MTTFNFDNQITMNEYNTITTLFSTIRGGYCLCLHLSSHTTYSDEKAIKVSILDQDYPHIYVVQYDSYKWSSNTTNKTINGCIGFRDEPTDDDIYQESLRLQTYINPKGMSIPLSLIDQAYGMMILIANDKHFKVNVNEKWEYI